MAHNYPVVTLVNDVRANVERFNREEAVWRHCEEKLRMLRRVFPTRAKRREERLQRLAWSVAEREMGGGGDCVGKELP